MEKTERSKNRAHVLILCYPTQGHINPTMQFAKRLVSKGLRATLCTTNFITKSVQIQAGPVGIEPISDGCDEHGFAEAASVEDYLDRLESVGSRSLAELIDKLARSGHPVSCLVYDAFLPWALKVAKEIGLIGAAFFTMSCAVGAISYHMYRHGKSSVPAGVAEIPMPGMPKLEISDVPSFFSDMGAYPAYTALILNQFSNLEDADWVLFNTIDKLEDEIGKWMAGLWRMKTIGPTVPSKYLDKQMEEDDNYSINLYKADSGTCMKWLDEKPARSVVYVSFGSMAVLGVEQMEEVAMGLRGCNNNFLWVVRETEKNKLPTKFTEEMADKGLVVTWSPQLDVLAHESIGCFVSHCGWNSTLEALSLGVPMVGVPQWTDQPTNAKFIADVWGVGVRARVDEKGIVTREEMEFSIREVMEGGKAEEIKRNSSKWKELVKQAMEKGGSSDKNIEEFVAGIVKS